MYGIERGAQASKLGRTEGRANSSGDLVERGCRLGQIGKQAWGQCGGVRVGGLGCWCGGKVVAVCGWLGRIAAGSGEQRGGLRQTTNEMAIGRGWLEEQDEKLGVQCGMQDQAGVSWWANIGVVMGE